MYSTQHIQNNYNHINLDSPTRLTTQKLNYFNSIDSEVTTTIDSQCYVPSQLPVRKGSNRGVDNPYTGFGKNEKIDVAISFHHIIALGKFNEILIDFFKTANIKQKTQFINNIIDTIVQQQDLFKNPAEIMRSLNSLFANLNGDESYFLDETQKKFLDSFFNYLYFNGFAGPDEQTRFPVLKAENNLDRLAYEFIPKIQYQLLSKLSKTYDSTEKIELLLKLSEFNPDAIKYDEDLWRAVIINNTLYQSPINLVPLHQELNSRIDLKKQKETINELLINQEIKKQLSSELKVELTIFNKWKNQHKTIKGLENQIPKWLETVPDMKEETYNKFIKLLNVDNQIKALMSMQTKLNLPTISSSPVITLTKIMNESPYSTYGTKNIHDTFSSLKSSAKNLNTMWIAMSQPD